MSDAPAWLFPAFAAALGAIIGSFLNVCIHRLPRDLSIVRPRSACPGCGRLIAWYDNVPIVSWVLLRARCRGCGATIAARYPLVESATAALFLSLAILRGPGIAFAADAAFAAALVALIVIDAEHQILPDAITLPGIVLGLLLAPVQGFLDPAGPGPRALLLDRFAGAVFGYLLLFAVNAAYRGWQGLKGVKPDDRLDGIGRGDFKLLAMIGAFLGLRLMLFTLFAGAVTGAAWGIYLMIFRGYGWRSKLPYGVFLGAAAILALYAGEPVVRWYAARLEAFP